MGKGPIEIITRAEALSKGLRFYFTGKPCVRGHVAPRVFLGKCGVCTVCRKIIATDWREQNRDKHNAWGRNNPDKLRAAQKRYDDKHSERRKKSRLDWYLRNKQKQRAYQRRLKKRLRETSADYRFRCNLRGRIHKAIRRGDGLKSGRTLDLIGCTVAELRAHLERQFLPGMAWSNYGHGADRWNVDHLVPCAAFDLSDPEQQRRCFHFSNLRPLWQPDNIRKGARLAA